MDVRVELIVYDATEGKIVLELMSLDIKELERYKPRLAKLVSLIGSIDEDSILTWDYFRLAAEASELRDLLEETGLTSTTAIRVLLHPWLLPITYLLGAGLGLAVAIPYVELLEHLPRLPKKISENPIRDYATRLAYGAWISGIIESVVYLLLDSVTPVLLHLLGLWDPKVSEEVLNLVSGQVWAPLIEEPTKRLMAELAGLPRPIAGAWYGVLEAIGWGEIGLGGTNFSVKIDIDRVIGRMSEHTFYLIQPLPLGALLHSLTHVGIDFGEDWWKYWPAILGPILAILGSLVEHALTGVW